jgi:hypothetical protein
MTTTGHASRRFVESPGEKQARLADLAYFASHPDQTSYVRRVIDGEVSDRAGEDAQAEFTAAEWVLVAVHNNGRQRLRTPLVTGRVSLSDAPNEGGP